MHGNVWEWVQDCYKDTYADAPPDGLATSEVASCLRVIRGGSWYDKPQDVRSADRNAVRPVNRYGGSGFRVARTL
jgi:formylglycine-generating enzyme required for sulfatase activity